MSLETKNMAELEELASNLRKHIALRPDHSTPEKVELQNVQDWLMLRRKEATRSDGNITV